MKNENMETETQNDDEGGIKPNYQARRDYYLFIENKHTDLVKERKALIADIKRQYSAQIEACETTKERLTESISDDDRENPYMLCEHLTLEEYVKLVGDYLFIEWHECYEYNDSYDPSHESRLDEIDIEKIGELVMTDVDEIKIHWGYAYDEAQEPYVELLEQLNVHSVGCKECDLHTFTEQYLPNLVAWQQIPKENQRRHMKYLALDYFRHYYNNKMQN